MFLALSLWDKRSNKCNLPVDNVEVNNEPNQKIWWIRLLVVLLGGFGKKILPYTFVVLMEFWEATDFFFFFLTDIFWFQILFPMKTIYSRKSNNCRDRKGLSRKVTLTKAKNLFHSSLKIILRDVLASFCFDAKLATRLSVELSRFYFDVNDLDKDHSFTTHAKLSEKTNIFYSLIGIRMCKKGFIFSVSFAYILNEWSQKTFAFVLFDIKRIRCLRIYYLTRYFENFFQNLTM